jgi:hypothetical protein
LHRAKRGGDGGKRRLIFRQGTIRVVADDAFVEQQLDVQACRFDFAGCRVD